MPEDTSPNKATVVSFDEANAIIARHSATILGNSRPEIESCVLHDCLGRVLASPIVADRNHPSFDRVTRDGFAVRAADIEARNRLEVIGQIRAGQEWKGGLMQPGTAVEIMTGAPLPAGTDSVLMVEHAERIQDGASAFIVSRAGKNLRSGDNVVPEGSEAHGGDVLLAPGTRLDPDSIGLAASCGADKLEVYSMPRVAILATGDEIVERAGSGAGSKAMELHQIYDSNSHSLAALVRAASAVPLRQPAARDQKEDLSAKIRRSLNVASVLLITGGVSMGKYDLVEEVLAELGAEFFFTGARIQPGKPVVFGQIAGSSDQPARYIFGLPGNPVSTMVTFRLFVQPLLAALAGERGWQPSFATARLASEIRVQPGLTRFLPGRLDTPQALPTVAPLKTQGSGDLAANARANCYIVVPENSAQIAAGEFVRILLR